MARGCDVMLGNVRSQFFGNDVPRPLLSSVDTRSFAPKHRDFPVTHQVGGRGRPVSTFGEELLLRDVHYPFDACDIVGGHVIDGFPGTGCVRRNECLRIGRSTAGDLPCGISGYEINT